MMLALCSVAAMAQDAAHRMNRYNVVWDSPGTSATDSMPIGNGDLAANVYVVAGDALYLLLGKSDAFDWRGSLIKTGRVKVSVKPNPFKDNGAGSVALQKMLLNEAGDKIYLLPAWPKQWDADFKLHASGGTVLTGVVRNGKLQSWNISPESRQADVTVGSP
jgi:uncharacterized protein DUF5703